MWILVRTYPLRLFSFSNLLIIFRGKLWFNPFRDYRIILFKAEIKLYFDLAFAKRPSRELYDLRNDPDQIRNGAERAEYASIMSQLESQLLKELMETDDLRPSGDASIYTTGPYYGRKK